jgi:glycosyltransferase involved in cell wall biosynthesis
VNAAIVIPAFNEAASIAAVVTAVSAYGTPIVIDDGSSDDTAALAARAGAVVVRHDVNRGYDAALASGFAKADEIGAGIVVSADADGQLDPASIPRIVSELTRGPAQMVLGSRDTGAARWSEALFNGYTRLRFGVPDILCGMKGFRTAVYRAHRPRMDEASVYTALALAALRAKTGFAVVPVAVKSRVGASRFGGSWKANVKIARALGSALIDEVARR